MNKGESGATHSNDGLAALERRAAGAVMQLDYHMGHVGPSALRIVSVLVKGPDERRGDYMGVIKAVGPEGPVVAFHGGETFVEVLTGLARRFVAGDLSWREDRPWGT